MSELIGINPDAVTRLPKSKVKTFGTLVGLYAQLPWVNTVVAVATEDSRLGVPVTQKHYRLEVETASSVGDLPAFDARWQNLKTEELDENERTISLVSERFEQEMTFLGQEQREVVVLWQRPSEVPQA